MTYIQHLKEKVLSQKGPVTREEALKLYVQPLHELCRTADEIRRHFCSNHFDLCTIINGKSGRCSENCRFCAQSSHNHTGAEEYPLLSPEDILAQAKKAQDQGIPRYSIVTSGKSLSDREIKEICSTVKRIRKETSLSVCVSFGLLNEDQYRKLREAGVSRIHNNLETSRRNFPNVCTTHTFDDKLRSIRAASAAGLPVCSGGIMGLGETKEDRIDLALTLQGLGIKSIPVNMLNPIPGTPFENNPRLSQEDMCRIISVFRFLLPDAFIRLAGGRGLLPDKGKSCFLSGANAAITGDMLTTAGITAQTDHGLLKELGYEVKLYE
ncbi:MAG TPA: biotin synthase BioB [Candidatus Blautia faecavium]|uniref:Biotin synthase n=1 Tax=Candidatus Blautia faecavium TaxID=2838487 RepID=A0A9D2LQZ3_9FIRM|nr:biotin synthase BioB [Candidatus Blautia faecavium]